MTKEELEYNRGYRYGYERGNLNGYKLRKSEEKPCEDAISRTELKKWLDMNFSFGGAARKLELFDRLDKELPPVTPTQKTGHWFVDERPESDREIICSNCEQPIFKYHKLGFDYRPNYCPNCGAKMGEE